MKRQKLGILTQTFGERVFDFYDNLNLPTRFPFGVEVINPMIEERVRYYVREFFSVFFNDTNKRIFVFGINPGRFGSGVTGVPFTDPVALQDYCGIKNTLSKRRELSSEFVHIFIESWGGVEKFYSDFFLTAVSPVGFIKKGVNYNYYDELGLFNNIKPFIVSTLNQQRTFGAWPVAILFGKGKNHKLFTKLNKEYDFFEKVYVLEHPRYILQYKRKHIDDYLEKYHDIFSQALRETQKFPD